MTHTEDLIFRLRDTASRGVSSWGDLQQEAADELRGMWKQIEANERYIQMVSKQLPEVIAERDALLAACKLFIERDLQQEFADHIAAQDLLIAVLKKQIPIAVDAEREACAKLCDDNADIEHWQDEKSGGIRTGLHAKLIRARGQA